MRLISISAAGLDPELLADRCWQSGAAGIWESDAERWRVGVEEFDVARFVGALTDCDPLDVTDTEMLVLTAQDVSVTHADGDIALHVPPTVFGDGNHPTTATTLLLLSDVVQPAMRVLDVGCGTGILAVAVARAGAVVTAIDVDPGAAEVTRTNAVANGVVVDASTTPLADVPGEFDVVVANITVGSLTPLLDDIVGRTRSGGTIIVSGLLEAQWPDVADQLGGEVLDVRVVDGWVSAAIRR